MEVAKSHLDFSPRHGSGPCFRDLNYSPFDVNDTKSRRQHLAAYLKFMRPEVSHLFKEYAGRACRQACEMIYNREWKRPISPAYFDYFTDNLFWNLWFSPFGFAGPKWPWGLPKVSANVKRGEIPSRVFARYCEEREAEDDARAKAAARIAEIAAATPSPSIDPNSKYISQSYAKLVDSGSSGPEWELDFDKRKAAWENRDQLYYPYDVVGPFEVELPSLVPIETLVTPDLMKINELVEGYAVIEADMTRQRVIVSFNEETEVEDEASRRHFVV